MIAVRWGGKSKYRLIGGLRASAQVISYEISFFFILFCPILFLKRYKTHNYFKRYILCFYYMFFIFVLWIITCLAETNRAPFDFAEGEREIVSGFRIEYGALQFGFLYLREYGSIMLLRLLTRLFFFRKNIFLLCFLIKIFIFVFIWVRTSFPRFRYDMLMTYVWIGILPFILSFLFFCLIKYLKWQK